MTGESKQLTSTKSNAKQSCWLGFLASKQRLSRPVFVKVASDRANTLHFGYSRTHCEQNSNFMSCVVMTGTTYSRTDKMCRVRVVPASCMDWYRSTCMSQSQNYCLLVELYVLCSSVVSSFDRFNSTFSSFFGGLHCKYHRKKEKKKSLLKEWSI